MDTLLSRTRSGKLSLYEISGSSLANLKVLQRFIASTEQSRTITNDPLCFGCEYTNLLEDACAIVLEGLYPVLHPDIQPLLQEKNTSVLHVLRGGLNFGLRKALNLAYGWNVHLSSYLSAQRKRKKNNPEDWYITEGLYRKPSLADKTVIICGDVVASGSSLEYAFREIMKMAKAEEKEISAFVFFTIGGMRAEEVLTELEREATELFPSYNGAVVIYLEGRFSVPDTNTPLTIKETGTDLLRRDSLLSPEFIQSQLENPLYPIERCTIYDAGSRSFSCDEYLEDVLEYWERVLHLANEGMSYGQYLEERYPELVSTISLRGENEWPDKISLKAISQANREKLLNLLDKK